MIRIDKEKKLEKLPGVINSGINVIESFDGNEKAEVHRWLETIHFLGR
jgi:hypothetical protein